MQITNKRKQVNISNVILFICLGLFIFSLAPLFYISQYNFPSRDDYNFGYYLYNSHDTIMDVFRSAYSGAKETFNQWQGLFLVNLMLALVPSAVKTEYYIVTAYISIICLILSTWFCAKQVLYKMLKMKIFHYRIVLLIVLILNINLLPSAVQGFYWYPAVVTYTIPYCLMLFYLGLLISGFYKESHSPLQWIITFVFAIAISGCNYITIIFTILVNVIIILFLPKNRRLLFPIVGLVLIIPGFIISILAPGNYIRSSNFEGVSALESIIISFPAAIRSMVNISYNLLFISLFTMVVPFIYISATENPLNLKFKHPFLVAFVSLCLYASSFTPTYYAMNGTGLGRVENIRMFTLLWLFIVNIYYASGWVNNRYITALSNSNLSIVYFTIFVRTFLSSVKYKILILLVLSITAGIFISEPNEIASVSAYYSLYSGEAELFAQEQTAREELFTSDLDDIVVEPLSVQPNILFFWEVSDGISGMNSPAIEKYYNKNSITLK